MIMPNMAFWSHGILSLLASVASTMTTSPMISVPSRKRRVTGLVLRKTSSRLGAEPSFCFCFCGGRCFEPVASTLSSRGRAARARPADGAGAALTRGLAAKLIGAGCCSGR
jgi:hypothetical protein